MPENVLVSHDEEVLARAEQFLKDEIAPNAQRIDRDSEAMWVAIQGLCRLELLALKRPAIFGGPAISDTGMRRFQELIARYSGALAFLQTQHQGVVGMIAVSTNTELQDAYLPHMGNGKKLVGVGFSQLRRPGPPIMRAERVEGGYLLDGHVPWVTGWDYFQEFMVGAQLPDGRAVFGIVPLIKSAQIVISDPMELAAMSAANTVTVDFHQYFLPESKVALVREQGWIQNNDQINIAQQGAFALGCAQGGLDIVATNAAKRNLPFIQETLDYLQAELDDCRIQTEASRANLSEETTQLRLDLRAWQIDLAVRCAHAAIVTSSGAANSFDHPAQRVYGEALVFSVSAQTAPVMEATLKRLVR